MPYKDAGKRRDAVRAWKKKNRKMVLQKKAEHYRKTHPIKPPRFSSEEERIKHVKMLKSQKDRRYREKHSIALKAKKRQYYLDNKNAIKDKYLESLRKDVNKRIAHNLRCRLRMALKNGYKAGSAVTDLGCSLDEFREHISRKFYGDMTWENYGLVWHLDHIIPLCRFNLSNRDELLVAVNFVNYQPLLAEDNLRKNKYDQSC